MPADARGPRRILMTADGVGGVWRYTLDLAGALAARGITTTVAVMGPALRADQRAEAVRRGITVVEGGFALEWMDEPWGDVERAGEWLLELERSSQADLVHLNGFCHAALPWRAPVVVVGHSCVRSWWRAVHGAEAPPSWDRYSEAVARGIGAAHLVIAPSGAMLAELQDHYGPIARGLVIPNGLVEPVGPDGEPSGKSALVFAAGRVWDEAKNIEALCAIAPLLRWPVYVAGDTRGPSGGTSPVSGVRYLGQLSREALAEWYTKAGIYALPARYEPFGLSVLEAAAAGCALVLGDIRSLRENWSGAAVFVPPDNRRALAAAIEGLITEPVRRQALARAARARARQFTIDRMADAYVEAYGRVGVPVTA